MPVSGVALACALRLPASALRRHCGLCVLPAKQTWRCALRALSVDEANTPHNGLNAFSGGLWRCFAGAFFLPIARSSRKAGRSAACAAQLAWPPSRGGKKTKQNVHVFRFQKTAPFLFCYAKNGRYSRSENRTRRLTRYKGGWLPWGRDTRRERERGPPRGGESLVTT